MKILINSGGVAAFFTKREKLLRALTQAGYEVVLGGYETRYIEKCKEFHTTFVEIPLSRTGINPFNDIKTLYRYYTVIRKGGFDIIHSYTAKPNIYGSIAARLAGVKRIYPTVNGLGYAFTNNDLKTKIVRTIILCQYKFAFSCAKRVFFQNPDDADELIRRHAVKRKKCVVVAGSGVDIDTFPYSEMKQTNCFFLASRLLVTKGIRTYVEASRIVKKKYPDARFLLAGALDPNPDGISYKELESYVQDDLIEYLGVVQDMSTALAQCSVFVLPSYYREGVPHVILEAMSVGRAVLTTNSPGCKETVRDVDKEGRGRNGFLIEPKNSAELAAKMIWMIEHPEGIMKMGMESRRYAEDRFDVNIVNKIMMSVMRVE